MRTKQLCRESLFSAPHGFRGLDSRRIQHPLRPLEAPPIKGLAAAMTELCLLLSALRPSPLPQLHFNES
jgi:hypothetical protein